MRTRIAPAISTTVLVSRPIATAPASAKTVKACTKEWQADKAAMQAAGKTEKAYVAECSGKGTAAKPAAASKDDKGDKGGGGKY